MCKSKVIWGQYLFFVIIFLSMLKVIQTNPRIFNEIEQNMNAEEMCMHKVERILTNYCLSPSVDYIEDIYDINNFELLRICCKKACGLTELLIFC